MWSSPGGLNLRWLKAGSGSFGWCYGEDLMFGEYTMNIYDEYGQDVVSIWCSMW